MEHLKYIKFFIKKIDKNLKIAKRFMREIDLRLVIVNIINNRPRKCFRYKTLQRSLLQHKYKLLHLYEISFKSL